MNTSQRKVLKAAIAVMSATILFPPVVIRLTQGVISGQGFQFILDWAHENNSSIKPIIHAPTLLIEWAAILIITAMLWKLFADESKPSAFDRIDQIIDKLINTKNHIATQDAEVQLRIAELVRDAKK